MKLRYKFFLAFFVTNLTIVILLLVSIGMNLSSGFSDFVYEIEKKHVKDSITQLVPIYQRNNSWQPIVDNVQIWRDIVDPRIPNEQPHPGPPPRQGAAPIKRDASADNLKPGRRMSLYDSNKNVIVGKEYLEEHPYIESILLDDKVIGWIGLDTSNTLKDSPASEFLQQQYNTYYWIAAAVILLSILMAILLANHLLSPIKLLIKGTSKLRSGDFNTRINKLSNDEIGTLSDNFNDLANTLKQNQLNRHDWMSDTSHELRTPLTVIKSQLMAIQDGVLEPSETKLSLLVDEVDKLSRIVDDLYQLSSVDIGGLTYKKSLLDPIKLLHQSLDTFQSKFEQHSLTVLRNITPQLKCSIVADKDRLLQLFSNLFENSYRYTDQGGNINIVAAMKDNELEIQIQDSAPGVSRADQEKLFERFYRVEKSRNRNHGGSGLGLALCTQIVEAHQGSIVAEDSPLGGLSIVISLPIKMES